MNFLNHIFGCLRWSAITRLLLSNRTIVHSATPAHTKLAGDRSTWRSSSGQTRRGQLESDRPVPYGYAVMPDRRDRLIWSCYAVYAVTLARRSRTRSHRAWAAFAAPGYLFEAQRSGQQRTCSNGRTGTILSTIAPLSVFMSMGIKQEEVDVVHASMLRWIQFGTPYIRNPRTIEEANPYLPGMSIFGLTKVLQPRSSYVDARLPMATSFLLEVLPVFARGRRDTRSPVPDRRLPLYQLLSCPLVALPISVSGVDLPPLSGMLYALDLAARGRSIPSAVVLGFAASTKLTAWPAIPTTAALLANRYSVRQAVTFAVTTVLVVGSLCAQPVLRDREAFVNNVVRYPLGLGTVQSPAQSPLPGTVIARELPKGKVISLTLLGAAAAIFGLSLTMMPPKTFPHACNRVAAGLATATLIAPASRFGYFIYPLVLSVAPRIIERARPLPRPCLHKNDTCSTRR